MAQCCTQCSASERAERKQPGQRSRPAAATPAAALLELQHKAGNRAVQGMLGSRTQGARGGRLARTPIRRAEHPIRMGELVDPVRHSGAVDHELRRGLGRGEPVDARSRRRAEALAGRELPDVRVHRDQRTRRNVDMLDSAALTSGSDVLLGGTERGLSDGSRDWLLAHELAHAFQQAGAGAQRAGTPRGRDGLEAEADDFAHAFVGDRDSDALTLSPADPGLAQRVIWKHTQDLPGNLLLILDVDDGDFVGGCVRDIVPHVGIKLIQKAPHAQLFNLHVGFVTNKLGEYCIFFYESVTGVCEMKCFPSKEAMENAWEEVLEWLKTMLQRVLIALAIVALIVAAVLLVGLIVEAIGAALLVLLAALA